MAYSTSNAFNPKEAIRLVKICPGDPDEEICCTRRSVPFTGKDGPPKYNALSYVWGDDKDTSGITLDNDPFDVTRNLYAALRHLRDTGQTRNFWIDAICIDQTNKEEQSEQVKIMKQIYERAEVVVVWLTGHGGTKRGSAEITKALDILVKEAEDMGDFGNLEAEPSRACKIRARVLDKFRQLVAADDTLLPWLECAFNNIYWNRVWTLQEFVSARQLLIQCGDSTVDYQVWRRIVELIGQIMNDVVSPQRNLIIRRTGQEAMESLPYIMGGTSIPAGKIPALVKLCGLQNKSLGFRVQLRQHPENTIRLYDLLVESSEADATNKKDKIYSLVGLATACKVEVDYTEPLAEICKRVTKCLINEVDSLEPLRLGKAESPKEEGFPTWCPDWTLTHINWERHHFLPRTYHERRVQHSEYFCSSDSNVLTACGTCIGMIYNHANVEGGDIRSEKSDDDVLKECIQQNLCPHEPEYEDYADKRGVSYKDALLDVLYLGKEVEEVHEGIMTSKSVYVARNGLITLFKTNKGYVGRAFDEVKDGDLIFCLRGSIAPCILRRGKNGYTYVSQAYVHGFMNECGATAWQDSAASLEIS
ncbi:uncharacterized protein ALTATR162_LOCUS3813 [Alternaria atra]|uniref:Heterokaryon incompatibility domain-containing protein n=1 Tax=Alternaria atra TaxID=119953 RepID=A0A8J2HZR5_9PLEO|nr:uncharacterized protein ALTATR162_LOCUS3813 [Alternaria atra]CAG5155743.1 unnamed protein product [Alternaria atra]